MKHKQYAGLDYKAMICKSGKAIRILAFSAILATMATFFSCSDDIECDRVDSSTKSEVRDIVGFNAVVFNTIGDVYITQGADYYFKIQGPENVVAATTAIIDDGLLVIGTTKCYNGNANIRVDITVPELNRIGMSGTGKIFVEDTLSADKLVMELYGLGEIHAALDVDSLFTDLVGSGIVAYKGLCNSHVMGCSGDIVLNAYDLKTATTNILLSGIGDSYVTVDNKLVVVITGQGNVYYKGQPVVESTITRLSSAMMICYFLSA
ncbi:MAG: head GIN domain-containing protein [Cyclobacteriaceae bacterium]|nr:head GIN domain-containing protein [Cyclobacteriaceae bacterium]